MLRSPLLRFVTYLPTSSWCYTLRFVTYLPTRSWCYALCVFTILHVPSNVLLIFTSSRSTFQHALDATLFASSRTFHHARNATLFASSRFFTYLPTCSWSSLLHVVPSNTLLMLRSSLRHVPSTTLVMLRSSLLHVPSIAHHSPSFVPGRGNTMYWSPLAKFERIHWIRFPSQGEGIQASPRDRHTGHTWSHNGCSERGHLPQVQMMSIEIWLKSWNACATTAWKSDTKIC